MSQPGLHWIVAVSGASGAIYAETLIRLISYHYPGESALIITRPALMVYAQERSGNIAADGVRQPQAPNSGEEYLKLVLGQGDPLKQAPSPCHKWHIEDNYNLAAKAASGSAHYQGMVVAPCSMKSLAAIAHGSASNLLERAADVTLKERRRLILVPRETPLHLIHLRNMVTLTEAGAIILPAAPAFYQKPETIEDLALFIAGRIFSLMGIDHQFYQSWQGDQTL